MDSYSNTTHIPEALARLTEIYLYLGIYDQARVYAAVLGHNYNQNKWYEYVYELFFDLKNNTNNLKDEDLPIVETNKKNDYFNFLDEILNIFENEES